MTCSVVDCDAPRRSGKDWCGVHWLCWVRTGHPTSEAAGVARRRSEVPKYDAMHKRVRAERGRACEHSCIECGERADEWSYDHSDPDAIVEPRVIYGLASEVVYSLDVRCYDPLCRPCHRRLDIRRARGLVGGR